MFKFGRESEKILESVDGRLGLLARCVLEISPVDFSLVEGLRTISRQRELYNSGRSRTLDSKHLSGRAIDIVPFLEGSCDYSALNDCCFLLGLFYAKSIELDIGIRIGALWDGTSIKNNPFLDLWHIELL
jgi:peptidoglycan L-alanyl-D-glutamate endopeptidase CwlK